MLARRCGKDSRSFLTLTVTQLKAWFAHYLVRVFGIAPSTVISLLHQQHTTMLDTRKQAFSAKKQSASPKPDRFSQGFEHALTSKRHMDMEEYCRVYQSKLCSAMLWIWTWTGHVLRVLIEFVLCSWRLLVGVRLQRDHFLWSCLPPTLSEAWQVSHLNRAQKTFICMKRSDRTTKFCQPLRVHYVWMELTNHNTLLFILDLPNHTCLIPCSHLGWNSWHAAKGVWTGKNFCMLARSFWCYSQHLEASNVLMRCCPSKSL